jgi:Protein of unknown function (DUF1573)
MSRLALALLAALLLGLPAAQDSQRPARDLPGGPVLTQVRDDAPKSVEPAAAQPPEPLWGNKFFSGRYAPPPPVILHDFGTVPKGTERTYRFRMTNIYAVPMRVHEPRTLCRWVSVTEYTALMDPLETGHIEVKLDTTGIEGPKEVEFAVLFDGRGATDRVFKSTAKLVIRANSRPDIAFEPGVVAFGTVGAGKKAEQTLQVTYKGKQADWTISGAECRQELFAVSVEKVPGAATAYKVTAAVKDKAPAGEFNESIVLKTNDPTAPTLTLNATGAVQSALSLVGLGPTNKLRLPPVVVGKEHKQQVAVLSEKMFKVTAVEGQGDGISVTVLPAPRNKSQGLPIVFAPEKVGPVRKVLTIKTDTGDTVTLTVEATAIEK